MRRSIQLSLLILATCICLSSSPVRAALWENDKLKLYGDFRTRLETDFDSRNADGTERSDRDRIRIRVRLGMTYSAENLFSFGVRIRSGSDDNHQSGHITIVDLDDNDTGDADFNLDKWYMKAAGKRAWAWAGRNSLPMWKQNELLWDDDATVAGLAAGYTRKTARHTTLALKTGYFSLPVGLKAFSGNLLLGQAVLSTDLGNTRLTVAGSILAIESNLDDPDGALLLRANGSRDYTIYSVSAQTVFTAGSRPLACGVDLYHNGENYSETDLDPNTADNHDQTDGYVLGVKYGSMKEKGNWSISWSFANVEALAVHSSYAQDDWVRWGSSRETRATDMKGHELLFAYALARNIGVVTRLYLADAITTIEDGKRFRVDFNYKF